MMIKLFYLLWNCINTLSTIFENQHTPNIYFQTRMICILNDSNKNLKNDKIAKVSVFVIFHHF